MEYNEALKRVTILVSEVLVDENGEWEGNPLADVLISGIMEVLTANRVIED